MNRSLQVKNFSQNLVEIYQQVAIMLPKLPKLDSEGPTPILSQQWD